MKSHQQQADLVKRAKLKIFAKLVLFLLIPASGFAADLPDLELKSKGKPPSAILKIKKSSAVPSYEFHKASGKSIPRLDIGEESEFEFKVVPLQLPPAPTVSNLSPPKNGPPPKLPSPKPFEVKNSTLLISPVKPAQALVTEKGIQQIPEIKTLKEIPEPQPQATDPRPVNLINFKPQDYKLLEGLIFLEAQKNHDMALAYFAELSEDKEFRTEALYHYSRAAQARGLNTEVRAALLKVAQTSQLKEWKFLAAQALAENIALFDVSNLKEIDPLVQAMEIDISNNDAYNFYRAKYYLEIGNLGQVEDALTLIPEKSAYFNDSLLISALFNYRQGKIESAIIPLLELLKRAPREENIRSVGAMTLARLQFQKGLYKEAYQTYLEVNKSHALWLQAMVEQAWSQILTQDYEGAAGNMFSLHTDFFKNAYNPESYTVRTVGYLNLCQFGDAAQALNNMGRRYGPTYGRLETFMTTKKDPNLYETVRQLLKNPDLREVDGLPRSFVIELARHPSFINAQKHMNSFEDEISNFNKILINLIQREKDLLKRQSEITKEISETKAAQHAPKIDPGTLKNLTSKETQLDRKLFLIKFEYQNVNRARTQLKENRQKAVTRLEEEKSVLRKSISSLLSKRFNSLATNLKSLLDQTEVLNYEIYSGAGEQLRYQAAGGDVNTKERPQLKPEVDKSTTWKFKGEIWEDEIGHFRSSLKSVCPPGENKVSTIEK
jgi:hypothetical protein